jgi:type IV pilus assembly protein PilA
MFLQNLRARIGARLNGDSEAGFTLIELLVVMLILGILAAIALPAFFNQREKATDSKAKEFAHSAQVAIETYATENSGEYTGASATILQKIEPTLNGANLVKVEGEGQEYTITVKSTTENEFSVTRNSTGQIELTCETKGNAGCPSSGNWGE